MYPGDKRGNTVLSVEIAGNYTSTLNGAGLQGNSMCDDDSHILKLSRRTWVHTLQGSITSEPRHVHLSASEFREPSDTQNRAADPESTGGAVWTFPQKLFSS